LQNLGGVFNLRFKSIYLEQISIVRVLGRRLTAGNDLWDRNLPHMILDFEAGGFKYIKKMIGGG